MSALISFICQAWWPAPSWLPASSVYCTQSAGLSRQYIQPLSEARTKRTATSRLLPSLSHASRAKIASWSIDDR